MRILICSLIASSLLLTGNAIANDRSINVSGFGSLVATTVLGNEGYWVKHTSGAGFYTGETDLEINEESLFGLQGVFQFTDNVSFNTQVISLGQDSWGQN